MPKRSYGRKKIKQKGKKKNRLGRTSKTTKVSKRIYN